MRLTKRLKIPINICKKSINRIVSFLRIIKFNLIFPFFESEKEVNVIRRKLIKNQSNSENFSFTNKKLFCILEQGNAINNELTLKRKKIFDTEFSDVKRLNWENNKDDELADFFSTNMCWSEGRSFLYEKVKGKYEFYIFIDDDIDIKLVNGSGSDVAKSLKKQLIKYQPIHGSIPNNAWPKKYFYNNFEDIFIMKGGDLCLQIFRDDFASIMFPTWKHGSGSSMWYCQFIAHILFPSQSLYLNNFRAINTRHDPHNDFELNNYSKPKEVINYFENKIKQKSLKSLFNYWFEYSMSERILDKGKKFKNRLTLSLLNELIEKEF